MAAISTVVFDKAEYSPGDEVKVTVNYAADTPPVVSAAYTLTAQIKDASGNDVGDPVSASFSVASTQQGDGCFCSDSGNRTWAGSAAAAEADGSISQSFTATA